MDPNPSAKSPPIERRNVVFVIGLLVACGLLLWVIMSSLNSGVATMDVNLALKDAAKFEGREIKVKGNVVPGSILCETGTNRCKFQMTKGGETLSVFYAGERPDTFKDCSEVVVTGKLNLASGSFEAASMIAKCPSKYDSLPGGCEAPEGYGGAPAGAPASDRPAAGE
jgi:cytochrome c-type biogenesis protein CcmE